MRGIKFFVFGIFLFTVINSNFLFCLQEEEEWDKDNYGKIIGQIVDAETGEPINEVFRINFFDSLNHPYHYRTLKFFKKTNNSGYLNIKLKPGIFYLQFLPDSKESEYEKEPCPYLSEQNRFKITINKGQVTEVYKKVKIGGKLKIVLVDPQGNQINLKETFKEQLVSDKVDPIDRMLDRRSGATIEIVGDGILGFEKKERVSTFNLTGGKTIDEGDLLIKGLYPGRYDIYINFKSFGYAGDRVLKDVLVERGQTTEIPIEINMNDSTGIEGIVVDQFGNPVKNLIIVVGSGSFRTGANGYYKIIGLKEGMHEVKVTGEYKDGFVAYEDYGKIQIIKNTIINKNFTLNLDY